MKKNNPHNLTAILDAMEDGIYIIQNDYIIEFMNQSMIDDFGDGIGKKCYEVIHQSPEVCSFCSAKEVFEEGKTLHQEIYVTKLNKTYNILEVPVRNVDKTISKLSLFRDITKNKEQESKLQESKDDYKRLFEHIGSGVYVSSKEGKFINSNQAMLDMLGYDSKEELFEIDLSKDLYVRPEDRKKFQEMIEKEDRVIDYEVDFKRKDGATLPVLLTAHVRYDFTGNILGYEGIIVDLSHRKQMEKELKEARDFLNNIIQGSPNAVVASNPEGTVILYNRSAEHILGYRSDEVINKKNIKDIYPPEMAEEVMTKLNSAEYDSPGLLRSTPIKYKRRDGQLVEGTLSASIITDENGREIATVGILVDLREQLDMERKLHQTQAQLLQSEKLAAMGRLTSQIAHEVNNPLYGIMNTLELMKTEIPPKNRRRKLLDMSLSETMRLAEMLRKMLTFSKPDQEERNLENVNTLIEEIMLLYEKQLYENDIKLIKTLTDHPGQIYASKNQLRQVFLNMISNAIDAMPEGGRLSITTESHDQEVHVIFSDSGIGIKNENIDKIFDAFYTSKESVKGVGLGLSVCYGFIIDHGGDIIVKSTPGEGTTFTIQLPVHQQ